MNINKEEFEFLLMNHPGFRARVVESFFGPQQNAKDWIKANAVYGEDGKPLNKIDYLYLEESKLLQNPKIQEHILEVKRNTFSREIRVFVDNTNKQRVLEL